MLDMGFIRDIRKIIDLLPARRQNLMFSATFSNDIRRLADGILDHPASVQVTPRNTTVELVRQVVYPVDRERKRELLSHLIRSGRIDQALVFTRTKHGANRLAEQLGRDGIAATAIHGNKSQPQRNRALADFKAGRASILVATDLAARGIDIDALPHVVNFELPMAPEDYVHRIGRTARAGMDGDAVSLVCVDESKLLWQIESMLRTKIAVEPIAGLRARPLDPARADPARLRGGAVARRPGRPDPSRTDADPSSGTAGPSPARARRTAGSRRHPGRAPSGGVRAATPAAPRSVGSAPLVGPLGRPNGSRPQGPRPGGPRPIGDPNGSRPNAPWPNGQRPNGPRPHVSGQPAGRSFTAMPGERLARSANHRDERSHRDERGHRDDRGHRDERGAR